MLGFLKKLFSCNRQTQTAGNNSTQIQIGGDYSEQITPECHIKTWREDDTIHIQKDNQTTSVKGEMITVINNTVYVDGVRVDI